MTDQATLRALLAGIEAATGPDRELDAAIMIALACPDWARGYPLEAWADGRVGVVGQEDLPAFWTSERYTGSLDAAVALVENVLPPIKAFAPGSPPSSGWKINLYRSMTPTGESHASWECCIRPHAGVKKWHRAPTPALAVLCALVSALADRSDPAEVA